MTPKEKALYLVARMNIDWQDPADLTLIPDHQKSIECAHVAVEELINEFKIINIDIMVEYWQEVKQELEKL